MMEEPDLRKPAGARAVLDLIAMEKPDLVVMAPPSGPWGPWSRRWLEDDELWEARRRDLPLWKLCREVWEIQTKARAGPLFAFVLVIFGDSATLPR